LFDLSSDEAVLEELRACFPDGLVLSEESGLHQLGDRAPRWRFLVDPVDGSDNYSRGLPLSAVSIAVLEPEGPLALDRVRWAMVGGLDEDRPLTAGRDLGCQRGEKPVSVSAVRVLRDAFVSCELNHFAPARQLAAMFSQARAVRSYGCASRALAMVACGALDAHVDARSRLTAESFLAAAFMVEQAGGCVLDLDGNRFQHLTDLRSSARIVAAATPELAHEIAKEIHDV
jgi:myo-inositol-1(or 4)-monophosphatase